MSTYDSRRRDAFEWAWELRRRVGEVGLSRERPAGFLIWPVDRLLPWPYPEHELRVERVDL